MVRAPCCEKTGLKKGPWTPEEDQTLIAYIQRHGHGNWRALPKHAGLLRCGKSCRLRWTNYLRPDIKRGNFSKEEEETIINLHGFLGNRWSAIAAKLPGRTDNEIKNVWHTHLKKRLKKTNNNEQEEEKNYLKKQQASIEKTKGESIINIGMGQEESERWDDEPITSPSSSSSAPTPTHRFEHPSQLLNTIDSPMRSSSTDFSTTTTTITTTSEGSKYENVMKVVDDEDDHYVVSTENFPQIMEDNSLLWFQAMPMESFINSTMVLSSEEFTSAATSMFEQQQQQVFQFPVSSVSNTGTHDGSCVKEDNDFWRDLFREAGELTELPGF